MTTSDGTPDATATPEPKEATANVVAEAAAAVDATSEQPLTLQEVEKAISTSVGSLQGAIANRSGQDRKVLDSRLERLENAVTIMTDSAYEQKLATMTADEQAQFLYEENKRLKEAPEPATPQQPERNQSQWLDQTDTTELAAFTDGALAAAGIQAPRNDARLWAGAQQGMSLMQLKAVAQSNIVALSQPAASQPGTAPTPATPAVQSNQPPAVPPTMQDAPTATVTNYSSRSEMAKAALAGEIDSNRIAEIMKENGWR